jgi:hypothetical protein
MLYGLPPGAISGSAMAVMFLIEALSASERDHGRTLYAKSRSPDSAISKASNFPRGLDRIGLVYFAIAVLVA